MSDKIAAFYCLIPLLGASVFIYRRLLRLMHYFQQEEYDSKRFLNWCVQKRAFDRRGSLVAIATATWGLFSIRSGMAQVIDLTVYALLGVVFLLIAVKLEEDPRVLAKKKLVITPRARRILNVTVGLVLLWILALCAFLAFCNISGQFVVWCGMLILFQMLPVLLTVSERVLSGDETRRQNVFLEQARVRYKAVNPYTIGITGSYGKTTVKTILAQLLKSSDAVFAPPLSINTLMGITRQIRDNLQDNDKFAVIEMGAYKQGSIQELCKLTPPNAAIITAVGIMHLERFKTQENVLRAKAELAAALPADGVLWLNGNDPFVRRIPTVVKTVKPQFYGLVSPGKPCDFDCWAEITNVTANGTELILNWKRQEYHIKVCLWGAPILENFVGAFAMAASQGVPPELLQAAALNIKPANHRLEVSKRGSQLYIDDAYNSNPAGFAAALDVLASLPVTQRILITPGMVELGERQDAENRQAASRAAQICDEIVVVGRTNADALVAGVEAGRGGRTVNLHRVATMMDAFTLIQPIATAGAGILVENDLPDLYEAVPKF